MTATADLPIAEAIAAALGTDVPAAPAEHTPDPPPPPQHRGQVYTGRAVVADAATDAAEQILRLSEWLDRHDIHPDAGVDVATAVLDQLDRVAHAGRAQMIDDLAVRLRTALMAVRPDLGQREREDPTLVALDVATAILPGLADTARTYRDAYDRIAATLYQGGMLPNGALGNVEDVRDAVLTLITRVRVLDDLLTTTVNALTVAAASAGRRPATPRPGATSDVEDWLGKATTAAAEALRPIVVALHVARARTGTPPAPDSTGDTAANRAI